MKVRNGDKERVKRKQQELEQKRKYIAGVEAEWGTTKKDFGNKNRYKRYREQKSQLSKLERELKTLEYNSQIAEQRIKEFEENAPTLFKIMDNIVNEYGEPVDVMVGVTNFGPGSWGVTSADFDYDEEGYVRPKSEFGINTLSIMLDIKLLPSPWGTYKPTSLETTKHEMGHANYIIENAFCYMFYILDKKAKNTNLQGGHNPGNPSGERAVLWQTWEEPKKVIQ